MISKSTADAIEKLSYYCQSCYTSMELYKELVEGRKLEPASILLIKIVNDLESLIEFYQKVNSSAEKIDCINSKLEIFMDGYENLDYFYIKDIFQYEMIPLIEDIFNEIKKIILDKGNLN